MLRRTNQTSETRAVAKTKCRWTCLLFSRTNAIPYAIRRPIAQRSFRGLLLRLDLGLRLGFPGRPVVLRLHGRRSLGGRLAGQRRERPRHQARLSRRDERATALGSEGRARSFQHERAETGAVEIAIFARWFGQFAHTPICSSRSPARTRRDDRCHGHRIKACLWRKHCNFRRFQTCRKLRVLQDFGANVASACNAC